MIDVRVAEASRDEAATLGRLVQLYLHDLSEFAPMVMSDDAEIVYPFLHLYWSNPDRHPFLVRADDSLAGFVLVRALGCVRMQVAEFFVLRSHRHRGVGTRAAHEIFRRFPGAWELEVLENNAPARKFWTRCICRLGAAPDESWVAHDGTRRLVLRFAVPRL